MSEREFVVLGSGGFSPAKAGQGTQRNPAGYAVRLKDEVVLLDLGFDKLRQLARAGLDPDAVGTVFFAHRHPDHVGDLALLFGGATREGRARENCALRPRASAPWAGRAGLPSLAQAPG